MTHIQIIVDGDTMFDGECTEAHGTIGRTHLEVCATYPEKEPDAHELHIVPDSVLKQVVALQAGL